MDNSLLAVRDINHKYIVVEEEELKYFMKFSKRTLESLLYAGICKKADMEKFGLKNYKQ